MNLNLGGDSLQVLMGVSVLFSHVIPQGQDPQLHPLWCLAEQFGAQCFTQCSESCTHVIANMKGTEKTSWAAQQGKPVVTTSWCGTVVLFYVANQYPAQLQLYQLSGPIFPGWSAPAYCGAELRRNAFWLHPSVGM